MKRAGWTCVAQSSTTCAWWHVNRLDPRLAPLSVFHDRAQVARRRSGEVEAGSSALGARKHLSAGTDELEGVRAGRSRGDVDAEKTFCHLGAVEQHPA